MKTLLPLFVLFSIWLPHSILAQNHCGYQFTEAEALRFQKTRQLIGTVPLPRAIRYVPIQFHIVGDDNGDDHIKISKVINELCYLNQQYEDQEIQFYIHNDSLNYINNSDVYNYPGSLGINTMAAYKVSNVLNIYITNAADVGGGDDVTTLGYYSSLRDWVVVIKSEIGVDPSSATVSHEVGHFLGLLHPFNGCDTCNWIMNEPPCPAATYYGGVLTEYVDGSNCTIAGDFMCDTPADINLGLGLSCEPYTGPACDPIGTPYNPDVENFIGYFSGCEDYHFSEEQKTHMSFNLMARQNSGFLVNNNSLTNRVSTNTEINSFATTDDGATITWTSVPNATHYLVEISRTSTFSNDYHSYIVTETSINITGLTFGKKYYVKVMPYNQMGSCYSSYTGSTPDFFVTHINKTIDQINEWSIIPNPNREQKVTMLTIISKTSLNLEISIRDITGKLFIHSKKKIAQGENNIELNTQSLNAGLYLVTLQSEKGINVQKLIIE